MAAVRLVLRMVMLVVTFGSVNVRSKMAEGMS